MTTENKLRQVPKVIWRIPLSEAPYKPLTNSAKVMRYSSWIYLIFILLTFAVLEVCFSTPEVMKPEVLNNLRNDYPKAILPALFCTAIMSWFLWIIKGLVLQMLVYFRGINKAYVTAMSSYKSEVSKTCEDAALPIRELWFPLCKIDYNVSNFHEARIWWRSSDSLDGYANMEFYNVKFRPGEERLVQFPKCGYFPDSSRPGTAEFHWGPDVVIKDPDFG